MHRDFISRHAGALFGSLWAVAFIFVVSRALFGG